MGPWTKILKLLYLYVSFPELVEIKRWRQHVSKRFLIWVCRRVWCVYCCNCPLVSWNKICTLNIVISVYLWFTVIYNLPWQLDCVVSLSLIPNQTSCIVLWESLSKTFLTEYSIYIWLIHYQSDAILFYEKKGLMWCLLSFARMIYRMSLLGICTITGWK